MKELKVIRWILLGIFIGLIILGQFINFPEFVYGIVSFSLLGFFVCNYIINWKTKKQIQSTIEHKENKNEKELS